MAKIKKDVLLIGDTFVFSYREGDVEVKNEILQNAEDELKKRIGFEDAFVKALREEFNEQELSNKIVDLLNESTNPAVLHLSCELQKHNYTYDKVNCSFKHRAQLLEYLQTREYKVIGISTTFTLLKSYIVDLIKLIRSIVPDAKILLGGMFIVKLFKLQNNYDELKQELLTYGADYFIFNEIGEQALSELLAYDIRKEGNIEDIKNVAYIKGNEVNINEYQTQSIDTSVSDWKLAPETTYAFLRTSVSCMFRCKFCDFPSIADKYQAKSIDVIRQEFESVKEAGIKFVRFLDDTFNLPKKHFDEVLQDLVDNDYGFKWVAYMRCQYLDEETVRLMKLAGCIGLFLGLESGSNQILENMNKRATIEAYMKGISYLHKYDIPIYGSFIIGFPGETEETLEETIKFIEESKIEYYRMFTWSYADLSPITKEKEKYGIVVSDDEFQFSSDEWRHNTMTSSEALEHCKKILKRVKGATHCTVPFDYTFYLNDNEETKETFNKCLKMFSKRDICYF